jgi:ABC-type transport system involved in cytochrome c biogenesis permease subunit
MNPLFPKVSFTIFALAALLSLLYLVFQKKVLIQAAQRLVLLGFLFQGVGWGIDIARMGLPFLRESTDSYLFCAWVLAGLFLLIGLKYRLEVALSLCLPAILILYTLAHFTHEAYGGEGGLMNSPWASIHIVFAFLALASFFLSFILGLLFLLQELQLKRKKLWKLFERLPSLEGLDQLHYKALTVGFVLLTLGIITGSAWAKSVKGVYFFDDPRQLWSFVAWLVYAIFFQVRFSAGWRGRRGVLLSLIGFMVILFTFLEVRHA